MIIDADKPSKVNIYGHDVLFYIMNPDTFEMKFSAGDVFYHQAAWSGTILAPSPCIDYRGNAGARAIKSQIIGYTVSSNVTHP